MGQKVAALAKRPSGVVSKDRNEGFTEVVSCGMQMAQLPLSLIVDACPSPPPLATNIAPDSTIAENIQLPEVSSTHLRSRDRGSMTSPLH